MTKKLLLFYIIFFFSLGVSGDDLHQATMKNDLVYMKILLKNGADPNDFNDYKSAPLHWAAFSGHTKAISLLLQWGARINQRDTVGQTPLHHAVINGQFETSVLLLAEGALPNVQNKDGCTPIYLSNHSDISQLLREAIKEEKEHHLKQITLDITTLVKENKKTSDQVKNNEAILDKHSTYITEKIEKNLEEIKSNMAVLKKQRTPIKLNAKEIEKNKALASINKIKLEKIDKKCRKTLTLHRKRIEKNGTLANVHTKKIEEHASLIKRQVKKIEILKEHLKWMFISNCFFLTVGIAFGFKLWRVISK